MGVFDSLVSAGASIFGGLTGANQAENTAERNANLQTQFAQEGLRWKAFDATEAEKQTGINRLALLGVPTSSFSNLVGDSSLGDAIGKSGQDIGRAVAAATEKQSRADQLNEKLMEAKIANVNADTVRLQAAASEMATKLGQPGTGVPFPTPDPRGVVIPLMQRARDPRTGEIVWIPSEKAASPLQTIAASPTNIALAGRGLSEGLIGFPTERGDVVRAASVPVVDPYVGQWPWN